MAGEVIEWLKTARALDSALLDHMRIKEVDHKGIEGRAVAFPYIRDGEVYAAKFRGIEKKKQDGGQNFRATEKVSRGLYNEDALRSGNGPVVITEGEIDALSVIQSGFDRAVSLPDGWTENNGKRQVLFDVEELLRKAPYVIVAGDTDSAGKGLPKTVANILAGHDVRNAVWPEGCKDANDVLVQHGEGEVARCLTEAVRMDPPGGFITAISDLPPLPDRRVLRLNMKPFDFVLAWEVGAMSVGTGTPGAGKSTFATFAAYHVARTENVRVGMMSFETHPHRTRDHLARLHGGLPWDRMSGHQKAQTAQFLDEHFRIVHRRFDDDAVPHNLGWLRSMIYALAVRDGCKLILIDPWNELEHLPENGESMTSYINFALQQIRVWAEQYDTHICVIAHPRKMNTEGKPRSPTGYDIADSAAFFNKPSLGFSVHQETDDEGEKAVRVTTWKVRDTQLYGIEKGDIRLRFYPEPMTYEEYQSNAPFKRKAKK